MRTGRRRVLVGPAVLDPRDAAGPGQGLGRRSGPVPDRRRSCGGRPDHHGGAPPGRPRRARPGRLIRALCGPPRARRHRSEHGTILVVPVVLLMAAAVILVGVIVVAMGRGGEMAEFTPDVRPVDTDIETAPAVPLLPPPLPLSGSPHPPTTAAPH